MIPLDPLEREIPDPRPSRPQSTRSDGHAAKKLGLGVVGCGDVLTRRYLPALTAIGTEVEVIACCDERSEQAAAAARLCSTSRRQTKAFRELGPLLDHELVDAVLNLAPAPAHAEITACALAAGKHVYSEKPLASTVVDAAQLISQAHAADVLLMCAPAVMAAPRFRTLRTLLNDGTIGRPTAACAHLADLGPAAWREYAGDPSIFYSSAVGTLIDQGVYLLHALTGLLGRVRSVQADASILLPQRRILSSVGRGSVLTVEAPDHVMIQLEFDTGAVAHVLSSFAVPATRIPMLEIYGDAGAISMTDHLTPDGPIGVFVVPPNADDGAWETLVPHRAGAGGDDLVGLGAVHFVNCLRSTEAPLLDAESALHVLEIIGAVTTAVQTQCTCSIPPAPI